MKLMRMKLISVSLISCILLSLLVGCWDRRELEERISVIAVTIDRHEEEDQNGPDAHASNYLVSIQVPIPLEIAGGAEAGGGGGGQDAVKVISSTGVSVADALHNIQMRLNQELFMGHTRVIAISDELAREGVEELLDGFRRDPALRRLLWFLVIEGRAEELLRIDPKLEQIPMVFIMTMLENGARIGWLPDVTLGSFYISTSNKALRPILNMIKVGEEDAAWTGVALFKDQKMVGKIQQEDAWILLHLRSESKGGELTIFPFEDKPDKHMVIRPIHVKTNIDMTVTNRQVNVNYRIDLEINLLEKNFPTGFDTSEDVVELEKLTANYLEKKATSLVEYLQKEVKVDPLKLGLHAKAYHYRDYQQLEWDEAFQNANINVNYNVNFRRTGMKMK